MSPKLILASASPRRQELLRQMRIDFTIAVPNVNESKITISDPQAKVEALAMLKGKSVLPQDTNQVVLAADTVVALHQTIFEKPNNRAEAEQMLISLSGQTHDVYTGVMIRNGEKEVVFSEKTSVEFWSLTEAEINWYLETDEPYDKAGAYGIQNLGAMFVKGIQGDYYNVVGLPIARAVRELRNFSIYSARD